MTDDEQIAERVARKVKRQRLEKNPMHDRVSIALNSRPTYEEKKNAATYIAAYEEALKEEGYEIIDRRTKPDKASRPQRR